MADVAQILAEVLLDSGKAQSAWKSFAKDGAAAFNSIATSAQEATAKANSALATISAKLKSVGDSATAMGEKMKSVGTKISIGLGAPIALIGSKATKSFEEASAAGARLEGAFAASGKAAGQAKDELFDYASTIQKQFPVADEAVQDAQSTLLKFNNISGQVFKDARQAAVDWAVATQKDLPQAAQTLGQALNDPIKGIRALREAGVALTAEQTAQIQTWVASGQTYKAQSLIIDEFNKRYSEAAKVVAASDFSQAAIQANLLGDAMEGLGKEIEPVKIQILTALTAIVDGFNNLPQPVKDVIIDIALFVAALGPVLFIVGQVMTVFGGLATAATTIAPAFAGISGVVAGVAEAFAILSGVVLEVGVALLAAVGWPVIIAAALGALIVVVVTKWDTVKAYFVAAMKFIGDTLTNAWRGLGSVVDIAINLWKASWNLFFAYLNSKWAGLGDFVKAVLAGMVSPITNLINLAKDLWAWLTKANAEANKNHSDGGEKKARGGQVHGRSGIDRVAAWLTNGEFVHRVAAVRKYGAGFMHRINNLSLPKSVVSGYASGGLVGMPRMAFATGGAAVAKPASLQPMNFFLPGDANPLEVLAPKHVAQKLVGFSRERQVRAIGSAPAWFK